MKKTGIGLLQFNLGQKKGHKLIKNYINVLSHKKGR